MCYTDQIVNIEFDTKTGILRIEGTAKDIQSIGWQFYFAAKNGSAIIPFKPINSDAEHFEIQIIVAN